MERIKAAIEKAKQKRDGQPSSTTTKRQSARPNAGRAANAQDVQWDQLIRMSFDKDHLMNNRVISLDKDNPNHVAFDVLRTKIAKMMERHGWKTIGITSPRQGCGKTMVASNLAVSFSRQTHSRVVLADLDLKRPRIRSTLGIKSDKSMWQYLNGELEMSDYFMRATDNLAIASSRRATRYSSEILQSDSGVAALERIQTDLNPDITIYDLPPMLAGDDALAMLPRMDCVLLIAETNMSTLREIDECEREASNLTNVAGVIMNKFALDSDNYYYSPEYYYGEKSKSA